MKLSVLDDFVNLLKYLKRINGIYFLGTGYLIKEAASGTGMTCNSDLGDLGKDRILVTIRGKALYILVMTACLSLNPLLLTAS